MATNKPTIKSTDYDKLILEKIDPPVQNRTALPKNDEKRPDPDCGDGADLSRKKKDHHPDRIPSSAHDEGDSDGSAGAFEAAESVRE